MWCFLAGWESILQIEVDFPELSVGLFVLALLGSLKGLIMILLEIVVALLEFVV